MVFYKRNRRGKFLSEHKSSIRQKQISFERVFPNQQTDINSDVTIPIEISDTLNRDGSNITWRDGRRIVELGHLASQMKCEECNAALELCNIQSETRRGFGSILYIECLCGTLNKVTTNKAHHVHKRGHPVFDINTKTAVGKKIMNRFIIYI